MTFASLSKSFGLNVRRQAGLVGVDIGSHSLKAVQLRLVNGRKQIAEAVVLPLPKDARLTPESVRSGWLTNSLKQLIAQVRSFRGQTAACGLSLSVTEFRSLSIPPGSLQERREMIAQELAQDRASQAGELEFDYWSGDANQAEPGSQNAVNLLTVSQDLTIEIVEAMYQAGLYCETLDGGPFILARAAALSGQVSPGGSPVAVLDWGHGESLFVVVIDGEPAFTRVLKGCSVHQLVDAVARGLHLTADEWHQVLARYGISEATAANPLQEHVSEVAAPFFYQMKLELSKTFAYLKHQRPHLLPERACLVGGAAAIRQVAARLTADLDIPFTVWQMEHQPAAFTAPASQSLGVLAQAAALSDLRWAA